MAYGFCEALFFPTIQTFSAARWPQGRIGGPLPTWRLAHAQRRRRNRVVGRTRVLVPTGSPTNKREAKTKALKSPVFRLLASPFSAFSFQFSAFSCELYKRAAILQWLMVFVRRFFSQQFKRSVQPDGPKVGSVALSPRGDWRIPSDAAATEWLAELESLFPGGHRRTNIKRKPKP